MISFHRFFSLCFSGKVAYSDPTNPLLTLVMYIIYLALCQIWSISLMDLNLEILPDFDHSSFALELPLKCLYVVYTPYY